MFRHLPRKWQGAFPSSVGISRAKLLCCFRHPMVDTTLLYRLLHGRGHQSAIFCPRCLDTLRTPRAGLSSSVDMAPYERELCGLLSSLGAKFGSSTLIKHEFDAEKLKKYIGLSPLPPFHLPLPWACDLALVQHTPHTCIC